MPEPNQQAVSADDFHPVIREILFAPNLFAVLGLEPRLDYTDAEIQQAYLRKVRELKAVIVEKE